MKKKNLIIGIISVSILVGSVGGGFFIYNRFVNNIKAGSSQGVVQQVVSPIKQVKGLDLGKSEISSDTIASFTSYFNEFKDKLADDKSYDESKNKYMQGMKDYLNYDYFIDMSSNKKENVFSDVLKDIHSKEHRHINSITLVGLGKAVEDNVELYKAIIDVNSVDDNIGFHTQRLNVYLGEDKKIYKAEKDGILHDQANSTAPLTGKSIIDGSTNKEFQGELNLLVKNMKNKSLYNKIGEGTLNVDSSEWKAFATKLNIKEPDVVVLYDMFKQGKGEFSSWGVVDFANTDMDVSAITSYTINIANENKVSVYKIEFKRSSNKILRVSKVD
jgi:hypothetical protein